MFTMRSCSTCTPALRAFSSINPLSARREKIAIWLSNAKIDFAPGRSRNLAMRDPVPVGHRIFQKRPACNCFGCNAAAAGFFPGKLFVKEKTSSPPRANSAAANAPAGPPPMIAIRFEVGCIREKQSETTNQNESDVNRGHRSTQLPRHRAPAYREEAAD